MKSEDAKSKLHIISWLLKDAFWCLKLDHLALLMILPTIILTAYATYTQKENRLENITLFSWILMNIFWMLSEILKWPKALVYFPMGLGISLSLYILYRILRINL